MRIFEPKCPKKGILKWYFSLLSLHHFLCKEFSLHKNAKNFFFAKNLQSIVSAPDDGITKIITSYIHKKYPYWGIAESLPQNFFFPRKLKDFFSKFKNWFLSIFEIAKKWILVKKSFVKLISLISQVFGFGLF